MFAGNWYQTRTKKNTGKKIPDQLGTGGPRIPVVDIVMMYQNALSESTIQQVPFLGIWYEFRGTTLWKQIKCMFRWIWNEIIVGKSVILDYLN